MKACASNLIFCVWKWERCYLLDWIILLISFTQLLKALKFSEYVCLALILKKLIFNIGLCSRILQSCMNSQGLHIFFYHSEMGCSAVIKYFTLFLINTNIYMFVFICSFENILVNESMGKLGYARLLWVWIESVYP